MSAKRAPRKKRKAQRRPHFTSRDLAELERLDIHYQLSWASARAQFRGRK